MADLEKVDDYKGVSSIELFSIQYVVLLSASANILLDSLGSLLRERVHDNSIDICNCQVDITVICRGLFES